MKEYIILILLFIKSTLINPFNIITLFRFFILKLSGKNKIILSVSTLNNLKMVLDLTSHVDKTIFLNGVFGESVEINLYKFLNKNLKAFSVFFDIGANSGYFSLLASTIIKSGQVHAFEPVPGTYANFMQSINLNNIKNIKLNNVCVGARKGKGKFYVASESDVSSMKKTEYQSGYKIINCNIITLGEYVHENKIKKIDIIKLDVEGAEKDILFGSVKVLEKFKPVLIIEFSNKTAKAFNYHPNEIYDFLSKLGYMIYFFKNGNLKLQKKKDFYEEDLYCVYKS